MNRSTNLGLLQKQNMDGYCTRNIKFLDFCQRSISFIFIFWPFQGLLKYVCIINSFQIDIYSLNLFYHLQLTSYSICLYTLSASILIFIGGLSSRAVREYISHKTIRLLNSREMYSYWQYNKPINRFWMACKKKSMTYENLLFHQIHILTQSVITCGEKNGKVG